MAGSFPLRLAQFQQRKPPSSGGLAMRPRNDRHEANACVRCLATLSTAVPTGVHQRQVFELPAPPMEVTEHQATICKCASGRVRCLGDMARWATDIGGQ